MTSRVLLLAVLLALPGDEGTALHIVSRRGDHVVAVPYVVPKLEMKVLAGAPEGYVYECKQVTETRVRNDHEDDIVVLNCAEGVKLELKGIELR